MSNMTLRSARAILYFLAKRIDGPVDDINVSEEEEEALAFAVAFLEAAAIEQGLE